jgi:tetratricopeptide (TPR) repeat protein
MRNWNIRFHATLLSLLLTGTAFAQMAPSQTPATVSPKSVTVKPLAKTPPLSSSTSLEELLARLPFHLPAATIEWMRKTDEASNLAIQGDQEAAQGNWPQALGDYQQALTISPYDSGALYALGDESLRRGDLADAVARYRKAIYNPPDAGSLTPTVFQPLVFHENNAFRVMEYARLLSLTGQHEEALTVYRHGANLLNIGDGSRHLKLMLPDFGDGPGQIPFTPNHLQALAQVGWAADHSDFDWKAGGARLQNAVALFPDSPVPYFYRARYEARHIHDYKAVKADFDKAAQLGGADAAGAVQQEEHFFRHQIEAVTPASQPVKPGQ